MRLLAEYIIRLHAPDDMGDSDLFEVTDALNDSDMTAVLLSSAQQMMRVAPIGDVNASGVVTVEIIER